MFNRTPLAMALIAATSMWGQSVISAHSGVIHLAEGQVTVDGKDVQQKFGEFGDVKTGQVLATQDGRAEVLLTPGVFLRVNENSSFRMVQNKLVDTRIEIVSGTAMIQVSELLEDNSITLLYHDTTVNLTKKGLYRVDADQGTLRVFDGEAKVATASKNMTAKKGHEVQLGDELVAKNFDAKDTDAFYRWNERRDEYISEANIYAAKSARDSGLGFDGSSYGAGMGTWAFNPWFGMFTYMPYSGMYYSPFGYGYFSPLMVGYMYMPGSPYYYGGGYGGYGGGYGGSRMVSNAGSVARNAPVTAIGRGLGTTRGGFNSSGGMGAGGFHGGGPAIGGGGMSGGRVGGGGMSGGGGGGGMAAGGGGMSAGGGGRASAGGAHR
ncbi:MAG: hypothetical protein LAO79_10115 [Acidobacteriia bacterium]|nr:hypothetical protein [Terriglobia bacterium]